MNYFTRLISIVLMSSITATSSIQISMASPVHLPRAIAELDTDREVKNVGHRHRHRHRSHRHYRRHHHHRRHRHRNPWPYIIGGIIIGGAIVSSNRHYRWCKNRYRSYDKRSNTFQPYHGPRRRCRSPYYH